MRKQSRNCGVLQVRQIWLIFIVFISIWRREYDWWQFSQASHSRWKENCSCAERWMHQLWLVRLGLCKHTPMFTDDSSNSNNCSGCGRTGQVLLIQSSQAWQCLTFSRDQVSGQLDRPGICFTVEPGLATCFISQPSQWVSFLLVLLVLGWVESQTGQFWFMSMLFHPDKSLEDCQHRRIHILAHNLLHLFLSLFLAHKPCTPILPCPQAMSSLLQTRPAPCFCTLCPYLPGPCFHHFHRLCLNGTSLWQLSTLLSTFERSVLSSLNSRKSSLSLH